MKFKAGDRVVFIDHGSPIDGSMGTVMSRKSYEPNERVYVDWDATPEFKKYLGSGDCECDTKLTAIRKITKLDKVLK